MHRCVVCFLIIAASTLAVARAEAGEGDPALGEVRDELERQSEEIRELKARLATEDGSGGVSDAVRKYLESEEGKKALGESKTDFRVAWKDGLVFETRDGEFTLRLGGRVHYDMLFPDADDDLEALVGDIDATAGLRRARVEASGTIFGNVYFANSLEFAGTGTTFKKNYVGLKGLPGDVSVQAGYMKEPVSLEDQTSSNFITLIERSLATNAFSPAENNGFMALGSHLEDRVNWAIGDFQDNASGGPAPVSFQHNFTGRLVGLPYRGKVADRDTLVHVGASYQDRSPESETDQVRTRPSIPFVVRTQDTDVFSVDSESILGIEAAVVHGPWSLQAEWYRAHYDDHPDAPGPSPSYGGWYVTASWWVTGESRPYKGGAFARVKPKSVFDGKGGTGAWEVAARYAALDLDDDGLDGGTGHDVTLGVNWHLNPNARVMVNYVMYERHGVGDVDTLLFRFQVDF